MLSMLRSFALVGVCVVGALPAGAAQARLAVDGTELVLTLADGRVLRSAAPPSR